MRSPQQLRALVKPPKPVAARNDKRRGAAFAFAYHSVERVNWVQRRPCAWCMLRGVTRISFPSDNAHTESRGAKLKGHYSTVVELCRAHHQAFDDHRKPFDKPSARLALQMGAQNTQREWAAYRASRGEDQ